MDWLDYRQALGLSFNDDQKKNLFIKRIEVFMRSGKRYSFTERDEIAFAYMIGETYLPSDREPLAFCLDEELVGLQKVWPTSDNASDIADKFRKTLENFFQEFFGGNKSLENYKNTYGTYLKSQGVPKEVSGNFETLLQAYTSFMNNYAKHRDATSNRLLEYLMYQTGNIIRLLITLKQGEDKQ